MVGGGGSSKGRGLNRRGGMSGDRSANIGRYLVGGGGKKGRGAE